MTKVFSKRNMLIALSIVLIILIFIYIIPVSVPIILAVLTALVIDPLVSLVERKFKWDRKWAVISVYIFVLALISYLSYYTVTRLIGKIIDFTTAAPSYFNILSGKWIDMQDKLFLYTDSMPRDVIESIQIEFRSIFDSIRISFLELVSYEKIMALMADVPNFLVSFIVFMIALFLFMLELPELKKSMFKLFTEETADKVKYMVNKLNSIILGFIKAQLLVSVIILAVTLIGLFIIKPEYALVMSLVIWIIDIIPILGSIIILAPWSLYYFISGDVSTGTQLAILAVILLVIRRTIEPKIMGSQIGLKPLPTLIAMFIGLKLIGFLGFFIGPLAVILFTTARDVGLIKIKFKI